MNVFVENKKDYSQNGPLSKNEFQPFFFKKKRKLFPSFKMMFQSSFIKKKKVRYRFNRYCYLPPSFLVEEF